MLLIFGFFGSRPLLRLLNTKPELLDKATLYMQIYFCGMPALALYNFGNAVYSAIGNTKKPLYYLLFSGIVNVVLNLVFVIVCDLDVAGVALASIISQYLSAIFLTAALFRSREAYGLSPKLLRLHRKNCREILTLGIPAACKTPFSTLPICSFRRASTALTPLWWQAIPPPPMPTAWFTT